MNRCILLAAGMMMLGCADGPMEPEGETQPIQQTQQAMGMCMFGCGGGDPADSDWPAPTTALLGEYRLIGKMKSANRIAIGPQGRLAVSDPRMKKTFLMTANGGALGEIVGVERPLGVTFDNQGRLYIGDGATGSVSAFDPNGAFLFKLGSGDGEFVWPHEMAYDNTRRLIYVVDGKADQVAVYGIDGQRKFSFGSNGAGAGQFNFPTGIALDLRNARVYVVDHNNARIQLFDWDGSWRDEIGEYGSGKSQFNRPQGIAVDDTGRIYVADAYQGRIQILDDQGLHIGYLGGFGDGEEQLYLPTDLLIDSFNRLWITSYHNGKTVAYGLDRYSDPPTPMNAVEIRVTPRTLNMASQGKWIAVTLDAVEGGLEPLIPGSILLQNQLTPSEERTPEFGDWDNDGVNEWRVSFLRGGLIAALGALPGQHELSVLGRLSTGEYVSGTASITLVAPGR